MDERINRDLLDFIAASPTAWHAAENLAENLLAAGYRELREEEDWALSPGARCFVRRNGSSLSAGESESVPVLCVFDNEEVGNRTRQGAGADFLAQTLGRISSCLGWDLHRLLAQSFLVSADNAHAVHPNHPEYADRVDRPTMNGGVVIKSNAAQRYITDAVSTAVFREICRRAEVPVQRYTNRADLAGGGTLGHVSLGQVAVRSVDAGLAQLAMHSCYETGGARDTVWMIRAAERFFASSLRLEGETITIRDGGGKQA